VLSGSAATFEDIGVGSPGSMLVGYPTRFWYSSDGTATDWAISYATSP
jgi:hypothetical protein